MVRADFWCVVQKYGPGVDYTAGTRHTAKQVAMPEIYNI